MEARRVACGRRDIKRSLRVIPACGQRQVEAKKVSEELDTLDVDRWLGVPLRRCSAMGPVYVNDIRRWVQAIHHPNPLYYDVDCAAENRFGGIVAPQSFTSVCKASHGAQSAPQGRMAESHMLFAGDEWCFFGPRIRPGDRVTVNQMVFDYRRTHTRFAGPTVIQPGDNHYTNQRGQKIALQRSIAMRYRPSDARDTAAFADNEDIADLSDDDPVLITKEKRNYVGSITALGHGQRSWDGISEGDRLPVKVIGPHSVVLFATEWRAYTMNVWHAMSRQEYAANRESGWTEEMPVSAENATWEPEFADGASYVAARSHLSEHYVRRIGAPRPHGYGASLDAWVLDYLSTWIGEWGLVEHANSQYRDPAFADDDTYLLGTVTGKSNATDPAQGRVHIDYVATNQKGSALVKGTGMILMP